MMFADHASAVRRHLLDISIIFTNALNGLH